MKKLFIMAIVLFSCGAISLAFKNAHPGYAAPGQNNQVIFNPDDAKKEVEAGNKLFMESVAKGDSVTAANCYTKDAEFMGANAPALVGRNNILSAFSGFIKAGVTQIGLKVTNVWDGNGILAEEGVFTVATKDGHQLDRGKYIALWKKEDGQWKIFRDCSNSDLPLPAAK